MLTGGGRLTLRLPIDVLVFYFYFYSCILLNSLSGKFSNPKFTEFTIVLDFEIAQVRKVIEILRSDKHERNLTLTTGRFGFDERTRKSILRFWLS